MTAVWILGAFGLAVLAQALKTTQTLPGAAFSLDLVAVVILARVLRRQPLPTAPPVPLTRPLGRPTLTAACLMAIGAVIAAACTWSLVVSWTDSLLPVLLVGPLALLCLAAGLDAWFGWASPWASLRQGAWLRRETQWLLLIVFVGVLFRFGSLGFFPPLDGFESIEETQVGTGAMTILNGGARPWEWPLSWYLAAASFDVFGSGTYALRVPVILLGCLTLVPFYLLLREMTAVPAALSATALLAASRWHVQVSWYNDPVFVPLFPVVLVLYLMLRTQRVPRPSSYLLIGVLCGYMLYDYAAFRIMPAVVVLFYLAAAWRARGVPADWRQLIVLGCGLALLALPLAGIISRIGVDAYLESLHRATANTEYYTSDVRSFVVQRLNRVALTSDAFTTSDHEAFLESLNPRGAALLDPFTSVAFVLGFGTAVLQPRRRYYALFAGTFVLLAAGATIVVQQLDFRRLALLIPFVFIFVAWLIDELDTVAAPRRQRAFRVALALLVVIAGGYNGYFLFGVLARDHMVRSFHRDSYTVPAFYLRRHYQGEYVVLLTTEAQNFFSQNDYDWIKPDGLQGRTVRDISALLPIDPPPPPGREVLVLAEWPADLDDVMRRVGTAYPGAACEIRRDPDAPRWPGGPNWDLGVCRIAAAGHAG